MKRRVSGFAALITVAVLALLAACSRRADPPANTSVSPATATNPASGGSGGAGAAGRSAAAVGGAGAAGRNAAAVGGAGAADLSTAAVGGAGAAGLGTAAVGGAGAAGLGTTAVGGAGSGAATAGAAGSTIPATFDTIKFVITSAPCFGPGCHDDPMNRLKLKVDDDLHTRLTSHVSKNCGQLVNPSNPQESALVKVLKGPCGATPRMPLGCVDDGDSKCIPSDYIQAITQWIADGAPK